MVSMGLRLTLVVLATLLAMFTVINAGNYTDIPTTCKFVNGTDGYRDKNEPGPVSRFAMKMEIAFTKPCFRLLKELVEATPDKNEHTAEAEYKKLTGDNKIIM